MVSIHPTADVKTDKIGCGTRIWQFCVIFENSRIGQNCNICAHVLIESDVIVGDNVTIKSGVQLWDKVRIGNNVFIGPNVTFTNDLVPRSKRHEVELKSTYIEDGASIGANSTIIAGVTVGRSSLIGAGSVVTKDVPHHTVWYGNPARLRGYITDDGKILDLKKRSKDGVKFDI